MELTTRMRSILYEFMKLLAVVYGMNISKLSEKICKSHYRGYLRDLIRSGKLNTITKTLISVSNILNTDLPVSFLHDILNNDYTEQLNQMKELYLQVINKYNGQKYNYIGRIRRSKGISAKDLAKRLGVSYGDINIIETCKRPNILTIIKVAPVLGLSKYDLGKKFSYTNNQIMNTIRVNNPNSICHYLYALRQKHGYTQEQLSNLLDITQTKVSAMESLRPPTLVTLMKLANIYKIPVITLLHKHPKYKNIEKGSPSYAIIKLCMKEHISPQRLSNESNILGSINHIINTLQYETDYIDISVSHELINLFNLPKNYFRKVVDKRFITSFNRFKYNNPQLTELDFGYRFAKMRYKNHYTLNDLGEKLHLTRERIRQFESTKQLNINYNTLNEILKIFPTEDIKYLKGDYHYLKDIFNNNTVKLIDKDVKNITNNSDFNVEDFFKYLYHTLHMNNKDIVNMLNSGFNELFYNDVKANNIAYAKESGHPVVSLAMKLADVFDISLLKLLNECPRYRYLELYSPSYKIFKVSFNNNITDVKNLSKYVKIPPYEIKNICLHAQHNSDSINDSISSEFIQDFNLPKDYFIRGTYESKSPVKAKNNKYIETYYKSYHAVIDMYLIIIKLLVMDNKNLAAITFINQLNKALKRSKYISVEFLLQLYLHLLKAISVTVTEFNISNNKVHNMLKIWLFRIKYMFLKEITKKVSFAYNKRPNLSKGIAGTLNEKYISLFVKWINFYRSMYKLPGIKLNNYYCEDIQYGVDELTLVNKGIHHGFSNLVRPKVISKDEWNTGSMATLSSSISKISTDPGVLISKYLNNDLDIKHSREWLLDKGLQQVGVGQTKTYNGLLIMNTSDLNNKNNYSNSIIAFPNHGVFPFENVQNGKWGLYLPEPLYSKDLYSNIQRDGLSINVHDNTDNKFIPVSNIDIEDLFNYGYYISISYSVYNTEVNHNYTVTITGIPCINKYSYHVTLFKLKI